MKSESIATSRHGDPGGVGHQYCVAVYGTPRSTITMSPARVLQAVDVLDRMMKDVRSTSPGTKRRRSTLPGGDRSGRRAFGWSCMVVPKEAALEWRVSLAQGCRTDLGFPWFRR